MAAERTQERCPPIYDDTSKVCHLWRLPIEILDIIFELSFVPDRSLDALKYANRRKQHLNTPLDRSPMRMPKVRRRPTQLAVSRDWYTLALRSWLRIGTLIVSATTIHNLRGSSATLRSRITSIKLRIDKEGLDDYARRHHDTAQMDTYIGRRLMARKFTKEVLDLCSNLQRLKLTRMNFIDFLALENLRPYGKGSVDRPAWTTTVFDEAWATIFVGHENLQHLALFTRFFRGWSGSIMDHEYTRSAVEYFNVKLKCRGIPIDDHKAVSKAIGYDESVEYRYVRSESIYQILRFLHVCKFMYEPGAPGRNFFASIDDRVFRQAFG